MIITAVILLVECKALMGFERLLDWSRFFSHGRMQLPKYNEQWLLSKAVYLNLNYTALFRAGCVFVPLSLTISALILFL